MRSTFLALRTAKYLALCCLILILFSSGCATGVSRVKLNNPLDFKSLNDQNTKVALANNAGIQPVADQKIKVVIKRIKDDRPDISCIGAKKNAYGMKMGKVDVEEGTSFLDLFKMNLVKTFELAGYDIVPVNLSDIKNLSDPKSIKAIVDVHVKAFWVEFMPGFFVVDALSDVAFDVQMKKPELNEEVFDENFRGKGKISGVAVTRAMFEESINAAYSEAMKNLYATIADEKIKSSLRK